MVFLEKNFQSFFSGIPGVENSREQTLVVFQNPTCRILQVSSEKRATDARLTLGVRHLRHGTFPIVGASVNLSVYPRLDVPICIIM